TALSIPELPARRSRFEFTPLQSGAFGVSQPSAGSTSLQEIKSRPVADLGLPFPLEIATEFAPPEMCGHPAIAPDPEAVAVFVAPSLAEVVPAVLPGLVLPAASLAIITDLEPPQPCEAPASVSPAEPVAAFVAVSVAKPVHAAAALP